MTAFRAAAALSTSSRRDATQVTPYGGASALGRARREVPLPSEEKTKSVMQYALYVKLCRNATPPPTDLQLTRLSLVPPSMASPTGRVSRPCGP